GPVRRARSSLLVSVLLRQPFSTLVPYTTLFRSVRARSAPGAPRCASAVAVGRDHDLDALELLQIGVARRGHRPAQRSNQVDPTRSEEHTSELQSRENLVCRLLLEKKKIQHQTTQ